MREVLSGHGAGLVMYWVVRAGCVVKPRGFAREGTRPIKKTEQWNAP